MSDYQMQEVRVSRIETITAQVKRFTLTATSGEPLPAFQGGSHIIVQMRDGENLYSNAYSLMSSPFDTSAWQSAVRLEEASKGGSRYLHQNVKPGDTLTISTPNNLFALAPQAQQHLLIAGGIGITPFLSHIPELEHSSVDRIHLHLSSAGTRLDLSRLLADIEPGTHIYTCGPAVLNDAVREAASLHRLDSNTLHFEQFALEDKSGDAFTLVLARSGREFVVPEEMTILQVIENNKAARVECLCREGVCGTCETTILEGEADHRDQYFSDDEKASQQSMLICCSRAKGKRLVLDL